ncbi:hypothetical protein IAR55_002860 [Kwoniella newhampshirensis]|uniref:Uncharacterized protein n=1 Tax=Kwoniella newhampshirensis TaxID=1651941 RepID=A0AAW0YSU6_9TREE
MLRDPASRNSSPFPHHTMTPHAHTHAHAHAQQGFYPAYSHQQTSPQSHFPTLPRPAFSPASSSSFSSHPSPIPSLPQHTSFSAPTTPLGSSSSSSTSRPAHSSHSQSQLHRTTTAGGRPRGPTKKPSGSTSTKQKNVQMSLEVKVEKAKGFHAFFVPLCKTLPPAPPCSPVHSHGSVNPGSTPQQTNKGNQDVQGQLAESTMMLNRGDGGGDGLGFGRLSNHNLDYFGAWSKEGGKERDQWVEHVGGDGMELDEGR